MPTRDPKQNVAVAATEDVQSAEQRIKRGQRSGTIIGTAIGLAATVVFYLIAPLAAKLFQDGPEFVARYFCSHPLEYITSAMFFVGMGILSMKFWRLPSERRAVHALNEVATSESWKTRTGAAEKVLQSIRNWQAANISKGWRSTFLSNRLDEVLHYSTHRKGGSFEDHLRYLADLANDRLLQSYSLIRTVTWAVPIMGFLGTVIGITMAIANVTPEQLDTSLPEVTSGLAVAFDTTAQALGISMILVFSTFLVERGELGILADVEQFGIEHLVPVLSEAEEPNAQKSGVPAISEWTAQILSQQTEFWNKHLATLQSGWTESLQAQTSRLSALLTQETEQTLQVHRDSVHVARDTYAATLQSSTEHFASHMESMLLAFVNRVDHWQSALQTTSLSAAGQAEELHRLGRTLLQLAESEQRLVQLQETLDRNLQAVQLVETLERTIASLNAAVSILAAKTAYRSAA